MATLRGFQMERRNSSFFGSSKPKPATSHPPLRPRQALVPTPDPEPEISLSQLISGDGSFELPARVAKIREVIDTYFVHDVQEVLGYCEKLVCDEDIATVNLGYTIVECIVKHDECTSMHRFNFYNRIVKEERPKHYRDHRSYLFSSLTDQGRNIEGFQNLLPQFTAKFYQESSEYKTMTDLYANTAHEMEVDIPDSLDVLYNIIKFNATFIRDEDASRLIRLIQLQRDRTASAKYQKSINLVDALLTYSSIPKDAVPNLTRLLCFWYGEWYIASKDTEFENEQQDNDTRCWRTLAWLLKTHTKDLVFEGLLDCLNDVSTYYQEARGAGFLIHKALTHPQTRKLINFNLPRLLDALTRPTMGDEIGNACIRLKLIQDILGDKELQQVFTAELDWTQIQQAIVYNVTHPVCDFWEVDEAEKNRKSCPDGSRVHWRMMIVRDLITKLENLPGMTLTQQRTLRKIALSSALLLDRRQTEKLIIAYQPSAFRISVGNWLPEIMEIAKVFISSNKPHLLHRQQALRVINDALQKAQELGEPKAVKVCGTIMLDALKSETNHTFRGNLTHCVITFVSEHLVESDEGFQTIVETLRSSARTECHHNLSSTNLKMHDMYDDGQEVQTIEDRFVGDKGFPSMLPDAGLVVMLMRNSMVNPQRALMLYNEILDLVVYRETERDPEAIVMLLRGLFRIRADIEHHIFFVASPEGESLAASLNRNADNPKHSLRRGSNWGEEEKPPAWRYGEIQGLPEEPPTTISAFLRSDSSNTNAVDSCLDMTRWLRIVTDVIETGADWEIYSYIIVHLGAQLSNQSLLTECVPQIRILARVICSKIQQQNVMKPPEASNLRQGDVALCLIDILTTIIGYHWHFPRNETENMITAFIIGLTAWDTTTVPCVHALTLCCYELPISLQRDLVRIVEKMATIVTKSDAAIHVLEFLAGMSRLEELTNRFHGDEIKTVFGVCFSYIEYARGKRFDEAQQRANSRSLNPTRQGSVASGQRPSTEDIPQYVFAISYHVITFWFSALKAEDQKKYLPWMEQRLLSRDQAGNVEDEALVTLDYLWRVVEGRNTSGSTPMIPTEDSSKTWISQYCILTILCQKTEGIGDAAEVVERRASGTDFRQLARPTPSATPDDIFAHYVLTRTMDGPFKSASPALAISMTDATKRALAVFDRASPIDFFKCGVIYVGESQTEESVILGNVSGSPDYNLLVAGLGAKISLFNHHGNVAGLDTSETAMDGTTTYQHGDEAITLNYHVTTLMPTDRERDPLCTFKKRHIGNDFVNIVFNNSGLVSGFNFHTFPSAFNYVYIVVTPEARQTFIQTRTRSKKAKWFEDSWFRVQVMTREDFPDISSAAETKVVSGKALASYVRNLALNAEVFCRVWTHRGTGEYPSSWRSRLGQIRMLRERTERVEKEKEKTEKGE